MAPIKHEIHVWPGNTRAQPPNSYPRTAYSSLVPRRSRAPTRKAGLAT